MSRAKKSTSPMVITAKPETKKSVKKQVIKKVLNVGGGNKNIPLPPQYENYSHILLDIDPKGNPDVVCDARNLNTLPAKEYDAIYCSHNLEHYYHHDAIKVLQGFFHVLKDDGLVHILVPDMKALMETVVTRNLDIDDFLYQSDSGPILVRDVIYGWGAEIQQSGQDYYAHKTGFTPISLIKILTQSGFPHIYVGSNDNLELLGIAFKNPPSEQTKKLFNLIDAV